MKLLNNEDVNWSSKEYYYDENGQAHAQHLHWGHDYTLENGDLTDDVDAVNNGIILFEQDEDEIID